MHDREESRSDNESGVGVGGGRLKRHPLQPEAEGRNQIETADHVADAAIVLSAIIFPVWKVPDGSLFRGRAFLPELAQLFELFCLIFAVTFYFSDLYYEIAKKQRKVGIVAVLGSSVPTIVLFWVLVASLFLSAYVASSIMKIPTFSALLVAGQALLFGMSFGMEVHYKGDSNKDEEFVHLVSESYDHSLSYNVPYLLATFVVVFPSEYVIAHVLFAKSPAVYYLTALVPSCAVAYFAGRYLERKVFSEAGRIIRRLVDTEHA